MSDDEHSLVEFSYALQRAPVLGRVHPLVPLCLDPATQIVDSPRQFVDELDDLIPNADQPVLLLNADAVIRQRFAQVQLLEHPPVRTINENLPHHLGYVRKHLLTTHKVASFIESDVARHRYELVVLLLVDGLGYGDARVWGFDVEPCFVDGPSITYRIQDATRIIAGVGFASIVGNPSVAQRLYRLGYRNAFGYTYWRGTDNLVAEFMFRGISENKVENFETVVELMHAESVPALSYVQIVRQGLDGLAHSKRELSAAEVLSATRAIQDDLERLCEVVQTKSTSAVVYLVADHGILWKKDHDWKVLRQSGSKPRYSTTRPDPEVAQYAVRLENSGVPYYLYVYPYLGTPIRKNDSGVHGGLSYQESFVPFIKIEV